VKYPKGTTIHDIERMRAERQLKKRRLEKAAPEMYEALKLLIGKYWANKDTKHEFISCITPSTIPDYWRQADKAIAKAEGGEA